jgi:hypothetical protein
MTGTSQAPVVAELIRRSKPRTSIISTPTRSSRWPPPPTAKS